MICRCGVVVGVAVAIVVVAVVMIYYGGGCVVCGRWWC